MITETDVGSAPRTREAGTPYRAITEDGVDLALTRFPARRAGQAPVLLTHGTFSNGGICARLAAYLAEHGFDAWVLDLRGHGGSQRAVPKPDFEAFGLLDVPAAIEAVRTHTGRRDLYLVGHSGGGLAFLMHLARRPAVQRDVVGLMTLASQATDACATLRGRLIVTGSRLAATSGAGPRPIPQTPRVEAYLRDTSDRRGGRPRTGRRGHPALRQQTTGSFEHQNHRGLLWTPGPHPAPGDRESARRRTAKTGAIRNKSATAGRR
jgi:alpha-beta hydrolase superfamily lysophospholipase